jgi:cell division protein FtsQ
LAQNLNKKITAALLVTIAAIAFYSVLQTHQAKWFPIRAVSVGGYYQHIDQASVKTIVRKFAHDGYFQTDINKVQQHINVLPWVASVSVSRVWPDKLSIELVEKEPIGLWHAAGLLCANGEVFYPRAASIPEGLPQFTGPGEQKVNIVSHFTRMNEILSETGLNVVKIDLSSRLEWQITLNNNIIVLLGNEDVLARLKRFVKVYQQAFESEHRYPALVDMRYNHGAAVKWTR